MADNGSSIIMAAPLQGITDAAWREAHAEIYGGIDVYFTPFVRIEHGEIRRRDLREAAPGADGAARAVPQIIFRDIDEFDRLTDTLAGMGHSRIDLNLGCPFPPQVRRGRGSGTLERTELLEEVAMRTQQLTAVDFSVKMRLGIQQPDGWRYALTALSAMRLSHVAIHPRTARQQYGGALHTDAFAEAAEAIPHTIIFNGDISDVDGIAARAAMPGVAGVMLGRGLAARPSLAAEWREGREWTRTRRIASLLEMHRRVFERRRELSCGDAPVLASMRQFWEYLASEIGSKAAKAIRKASSMTKYKAALELISEK